MHSAVCQRNPALLRGRSHRESSVRGSRPLPGCCRQDSAHPLSRRAPRGPVSRPLRHVGSDKPRLVWDWLRGIGFECHPVHVQLLGQSRRVRVPGLRGGGRAPRRPRIRHVVSVFAGHRRHGQLLIQPKRSAPRHRTLPPRHSDDRGEQPLPQRVLWGDAFDRGVRRADVRAECGRAAGRNDRRRRQLCVVRAREELQLEHPGVGESDCRILDPRH